MNNRTNNTGLQSTAQGIASNLLGQTNSSTLNPGLNNSGLTGSNMGSGLTGTGLNSGFTGSNIASGLTGSNMGSGFTGSNLNTGIPSSNMGSGLNSGFTGSNMGSGLAGSAIGSAIGSKLTGSNMGSGFTGSNLNTGIPSSNMGSGFTGSNIGSGFTGSNMGSGLAGSTLGSTLGSGLSSTTALPQQQQQQFPLQGSTMPLSANAGEICTTGGNNAIIGETLEKRFHSTDMSAIQSFAVPTALPSSAVTSISEVPSQLQNDINVHIRGAPLNPQIIEHGLPKREVIHHEVVHPADVRTVGHVVQHAPIHEFDKVVVPHEVIHEVEHKVPHVIHHEVQHIVPHEIHHQIEHNIREVVQHRVEHDIHQDVHHQVEHDIRQDVHHGVTKVLTQQVTNPVVCQDTSIPHSVTTVERAVGGIVECVDTTPLSSTNTMQNLRPASTTMQSNLMQGSTIPPAPPLPSHFMSNTSGFIPATTTAAPLSSFGQGTTMQQAGHVSLKDKLKDKILHHGAHQTAPGSTTNTSNFSRTV